MQLSIVITRIYIVTVNIFWPYNVTHALLFLTSYHSLYIMYVIGINRNNKHLTNTKCERIALRID